MADDTTLPPEYSEAVRLLYSADPGDFVAGRTELARQATKAGDRALAAQLKKLRRPTRGGWLLNLLAAEDAELVHRVGRLGAELAAAHRDSDAQALRRLSAERGSLLAGAGRRLAELAVDHGWQPTQSALAEATETLQAALADPELGERIAAGAMVATVRAAGFGPVDLFAPLAPVIPLHPRAEPKHSGRRPARAAGEQADPDLVGRLEQELETARRRFAEAHGAAERAQQAREQADAAAERADRHAAELADRIEELSEQLAAARAAAEEQHRVVEESAATARERAGAADRADADLARLRQEVEDLTERLELARRPGSDRP